MVTTSIAVYLVLVGLFAGSFVNLAADRLPRGESIVTPGSHCRACGRRLNVIDLLPVLGYLIRRGHCATCRTRIGAAAPVVEALCGVFMAVPIVWQGVWPGALTGLGLVFIYGSVATGLAIARSRRVSQRDMRNGPWRLSR